MIADAPPAFWVNAASAVLLVALGVFVASLRPRLRGNVGLALAAAGGGLGFLLNNLGSLYTVGSLARAGAAYGAQASFAAATLGLVSLARFAPSPLTREHRRAVAATSGAAAVYFALAYAAPALAGGENYMLGDVPYVTAVRAAAFGAYQTALFAVAVLLALRFRTASSGEEARAFAVLSASLLAYPVGVAAQALGDVASGANSLAPAFPAYALAVAVRALAAAGAIGLWIANTRVPHGRAARNAALALMAIAFVATLPVVGNAATGVVRTAGALILAFAMLRGQLPGLDVRVRWTISRSSVAAAFVAAFFLASEGAQLLFGRENEVVGLLAAGALVFAMAPLQRAAERLAEKAVPTTSAAWSGRPSTSREAPEETFRRAVRYTLRDRAMGVEEELHLARLATALALAPDRAVEIRHEVERARRGAAPLPGDRPGP